MAEDVIAVMDAVGLERADMMGYSMGGRIAVSLLARYAGRFSSVVVGGAGLPPAVSDAPTRAAIAAALELDQVDEGALRRVQVPVLAVVGDNDGALPLTQRLVETIPDAQLAVLPGEDHLSTISAQKYKDATAAFLKKDRPVSVA